MGREISPLSFGRIPCASIKEIIMSQLSKLVQERMKVNEEVRKLQQHQFVLDRDIIVEVMDQGLTDCLTINWRRLNHMIR